MVGGIVQPSPVDEADFESSGRLFWIASDHLGGFPGEHSAKGIHLALSATTKSFELVLTDALRIALAFVDVRAPDASLMGVRQRLDVFWHDPDPTDPPGRMTADPQKDP